MLSSFLCHKCSSPLRLLSISRSLEGDDWVFRECLTCGVKLRLVFFQKKESEVFMEELSLGPSSKEFIGFSYECPKCKLKSRVHILYLEGIKWKCLNCGTVIPPENIKWSEETEKAISYRKLFPSQTRPPRAGSRSYSHSHGKVHSALPGSISSAIPIHSISGGSIQLSEAATRLAIEPKRLRGYLRKINWRGSDMHGGRWTFSEQEVSELKTRLGR